MMDLDKPTFLERHLLDIIAGAVTLIGAMGIAIIVMAVQTMDYNARLAAEVKQMRVQQIIDGKKIEVLELDLGYRQSKVGAK